jgi:hypothetical protein
MFTFEELCTDKWCDTFAYWLLVEKKPLSKKWTAAALHNVMSIQYDIEEQAYKPHMLRSNKELFPSHLRLVAPVTLALKWAPFQLAKSMLGKPLRAEKGSGSSPPAMVIWKPQYLGAWAPEKLNPDARHFAFLLRLTCSAAIAQKARVLLVGSRGWSYSSWRDQFFMMNPDTALLMHKAGYLYTDRIPQ